MSEIRVGLFGFGQTGRMVASEFMRDKQFVLSWVIRKSREAHHKYSSRLLGYEFDAGEIISVDDMGDGFFVNRPIDVLIDFSNTQGVYLYEKAAKAGIPIITAISKYNQEELSLLKAYSEFTAVLYSPNITLGINVLMVAAQILQKIVPHADIEIVEEHFKGKAEVSGTAQKIANALDLDLDEHINSVRVGGIVGRHEIIFGLPNQIIRLSHESINRAAFGQGAMFAAKNLLGQPPGLYTMETIISEMFRNNIPVY